MIECVLKLAVFVLCLSLILLQSVNSAKSRLKLVIDQDGGADDAMAIFLALLQEKYFDGPQVVGLTTAHGNVNESQAFINTQRILGVAGRRDVPIYRGSMEALIEDYPSNYFFGFDGLGDSQNVVYKPIKAERLVAALALIEFSKKYEGELILVTLAPLTNIALAIKLDPGFISRLKHVFLGASNVYTKDSPEPEFNARLDVEAYYIVAKHAIADKVTAIPYNQLNQSLQITREWRINELGAIDTKIMKAQNEFEQVSLQKENRWLILDPIVTSVALESSIVETTILTGNGIVLSGPRRGVNTNNFSTDNGNIKLVYSANEEKFKDYLLKVFSADKN